MVTAVRLSGRRHAIQTHYAGSDGSEGETPQTFLFIGMGYSGKSHYLTTTKNTLHAMLFSLSFYERNCHSTF